MKIAIFPFGLLLCLSGAAAHADDAAMLACRALPAGAARLACYDAIPLDARAGAAAPATAEQAFGMEAKRAVPPTSIDSTIDGNFAGWGPNTQFRLANGQVWRVSDGSSADLPAAANPKVRIVRNLFGTMFLEIDGTNNSPKVRRIQ
ncbi:hypothetical protein HH212_21915 [Massilia forsythiae]|uniref:Uncharacterized protein n=1 Tax=Massilia forsythiae TaxID=2728020 RepID=A0A7Z2ZUJ3_9BURK|nr:hypothetical protein [Massilia forsythiae]QJE02350.1 hypothetical protein HH212_21915 [Massilia forsythiae]